MSKYQPDVLREYVKKSESRVIIDDLFFARMSKDIAKNFDGGLYDVMLNEHKKCIKELESLHIIYPANAKPKFYVYIVPDENFAELLNYPYKNISGGGRPVPAYELDSFNSAYGTSQNKMVDNGPIGIFRHINLVHEYSHLIHHQFGGYGAQMFGEGFAEMIPWYALEYENLAHEHFVAMKSLDKIYTANELLEMNPFFDMVPGKTCSFQPSYISSYLWTRAVVEHIRCKYNLSRFGAVQKFLELFNITIYGKQFFIIELAEILDMDVDKLLDSTEYQIETLEQIAKEVKK